LTQTKDGEDEKEETFEEDSSECFTVLDDTGTVESDLTVGLGKLATNTVCMKFTHKESVDTKTGSETKGKVGKRSHEERSDKRDGRSAR
jgi:hypothetical protein